MPETQPPTTVADVAERLWPQDQGPTVVRVGVDIGRKADPTAICVVEEVRRDGIAHFMVRSIERLPLGTPYPAVADRIVAIMHALDDRARRVPFGMPPRFRTELIVDGTGVGLPVVDLIRERGLYPKVAIFAGGEKLTAHPNNVITIGKGWLVSRLQVLLQSGRLHLPQTSEAGTLVRELQDYEISISDRGNASFNARSGRHDDLVISLGLAVGIERRAAPMGTRDYLAETRRDAWTTRRDELRRTRRGG